jgi:hypothetical protein
MELFRVNLLRCVAKLCFQMAAKLCFQEHHCALTHNLAALANLWVSVAHKMSSQHSAKFAHLLKSQPKVDTPPSTYRARVVTGYSQERVRDPMRTHRFADLAQLRA